MAGRGYVSGSVRNEVPSGGWSGAELCRSLLPTPEDTEIADQVSNDKKSVAKIATLL